MHCHVLHIKDGPARLNCPPPPRPLCPTSNNVLKKKRSEQVVFVGHSVRYANNNNNLVKRQ